MQQLDAIQIEIQSTLTHMYVFKGVTPEKLQNRVELSRVVLKQSVIASSIPSFCVINGYV